MEGIIAWTGFFLLLMHKEISRWCRIIDLKKQREKTHRLIRLRKHVMRSRDYGI